MNPESKYSFRSWDSIEHLYGAHREQAGPFILHGNQV